MKIRDRIKGLKRIKASELLPHPANWRLHPQSQRDAMSGILAEVGYVDALMVRKLADGYQILDGHLRAEITPDTEVPCLVVDLDDVEATKVLTLFDPLSAMAEADTAALDVLLREVSTDDVALQRMLVELAEESGLGTMSFSAASENEIGEENILDDDDNPEAEFLAPFPWFGGKSRIARQVWKYFGG